MFKCFKSSIGCTLQSLTSTNSAEVDSNVNFRFEGDLLQALEELEGLSLFPVVQFKAKPKDLFLRRLWKEEMFLGN